jgi:hypothetical protein
MRASSWSALSLPACEALAGARAAIALWLAGLAALAASGLIWANHYSRSPSTALAAFDALGLIVAAALLVVHWALWRSLRANLATRISFAGAALVGAAALTLTVLKARVEAGGADWVSGLAGSTAFALAIAVNFAPGVVREPLEWRPAPRAPRPHHPPQQA